MWRNPKGPRPKRCLNCNGNCWDVEYNDETNQPPDWYCILCTRVHLWTGTGYSLFETRLATKFDRPRKERKSAAIRGH